MGDADASARAAITEALVTATDLDETDLEDIDIDHGGLRELLDGEGRKQTFTIAGYNVIIDSTGDITVTD